MVFMDGVHGKWKIQSKWIIQSRYGWYRGTPISANLHIGFNGKIHKMGGCSNCHVSWPEQNSENELWTSVYRLPEEKKVCYCQYTTFPTACVPQISGGLSPETVDPQIHAPNQKKHVWSRGVPLFVLSRWSCWFLTSGTSGCCSYGFPGGPLGFPTGRRRWRRWG